MKKLELIEVIEIILLVVIAVWLVSCNRYCDPGNIQSGKSSQHHDHKKFTSMIRVMWIKKIGHVYHVRYENMKETVNRDYFETLPSFAVEGTWVNIDSI